MTARSDQWVDGYTAAVVHAERYGVQATTDILAMFKRHMEHSPDFLRGMTDALEYRATA